MNIRIAVVQCGLWFLLLFVVGCNSDHEADTAKTDHLPVRQELQVGTGDEGEANFGSVEQLETDVLGRLYVLDGLNKTVHQLGADGTPVRRIGSPGEGPGQLSNPIGMALGPRKELWVVDAGRGRYVVYDTTGALQEELPREVLGWSRPWDGGFDVNGRLCDSGVLTGSPQPEEAVYCYQRVDGGLVAFDTLALPSGDERYLMIQNEGGRRLFEIPYSRRREGHLAGGRLWVGFTDEYRIETVDGLGERRRISRQVPEVSISDEERRGIIDSLSELGAPPGDVAERLGEHHRAFSTFVGDDRGRLWVVRRLETGNTVIDVFNGGDVYLATVPANLNPRPRPVVDGNTIWGVRTDELDVPTVVRLEVTSDELR